ncbi:hypothetical protein SARC_08740 [Sphaeroforma arctica JP610]|uniref:Phospholipid scramblase n=1 Tax=Sphaeroforma arctica JP610 TaxID=667725 RepID=A0A0L0FQM0_9EUKA|nr:hypothetical protein SARC_08740 [Sphaeroforma arctica JP610]KNC78846.1 hypothetical protein SARC_08740 [Sphaeroforma arctica JP610]|eukprot:XP_014152748.1 hypothetical protein SARC_08740 [Sphaeroforma arctica JP610]
MISKDAKLLSKEVDSQNREMDDFNVGDDVPLLSQSLQHSDIEDKPPPDYQSSTLFEGKGVTIRKHTQIGEVVAQACNVPWEQANQYAIAALPQDKWVDSANDSTRWKPSAETLTSLERVLHVQEESSFFDRCLFNWLGCGNLRPLQLHLSVDEESGVLYTVQRDFMLGGVCGCPLTMDMFKVSGGNKVPIGRVRENFDDWFDKCFQVCCKATVYHDVQTLGPNWGDGERDNTKNYISAQPGHAENPMSQDGRKFTRMPHDDDYKTVYTLRANLSCCGRVNNCCGSTCFKNDMVFDVLDRQGVAMATVQKTYAPSEHMGCNAFCRAGQRFSNYLVEFPEDATVEARALIVTSVFQLDFHRFEKRGGKNH